MPLEEGCLAVGCELALRPDVMAAVEEGRGLGGKRLSTRISRAFAEEGELRPVPRFRFPPVQPSRFMRSG